MCKAGPSDLGGPGGRIVQKTLKTGPRISSQIVALRPLNTSETLASRLGDAQPWRSIDICLHRGAALKGVRRGQIEKKNPGFSGSGRPRVAGKPFRKMGGFAPHRFEGFPGRPGPPRSLRSKILPLNMAPRPTPVSVGLASVRAAGRFGF